MYAEPFVCDYDSTVASGNSEQTYNLISFPNGQASVRKNAAADEGLLPEVLKMSHTSVGKGALTRDRHLVRFEVSSDDGDGNIGTAIPAVAYMVFDIPRQYCNENTPTILARQLTGFLRSADSDDSAPDYTANFSKLMNGEM